MSEKLIKGVIEQLKGKLPVIREFYLSEYKDLLYEHLDELNTAALYQSSMHGQGHIERTMLNGALIAYLEKCEANTAEVLLFACAYHDIGRIDDTKDDLHGLRSAKKLRGELSDKLFQALSQDTFNLLCAAITAHSLDDGEMDKTGKSYEVKDSASYFYLAKMLKDADNLDRVRLHDLDTRYLRTSSALALSDTAQKIFDTYQNLRTIF